MEGFGDVVRALIFPRVEVAWRRRRRRRGEKGGRSNRDNRGARR